MHSKNEIIMLLEKYPQHNPLNLSKDPELDFVLKNLNQVNSTEKPDAYLTNESSIYAIEHFQISFSDIKKRNDISRQAKSYKENRKNLKNDIDFILNPSITNFLNALKSNLYKHSKSFKDYKENPQFKDALSTKEYKLLIFIENSSDYSYLIKKEHSSAIKGANPLEIKQVVESILEYNHAIWAVLFLYGNEFSKIVVADTLANLQNKLNNNNLFDIQQYTLWGSSVITHISKNNPEDDLTTVSITFSDYL